MSQIIGNFIEEVLDDSKIFMMEFFMHAIPMTKRKQTRYLSMAFMAEYLANFFTFKEENEFLFKQEIQIKSAANYIANELLENSLKYNYELGKYPLRFAIYLLERNLVFVTKNCVNKKTLDKLNNFINELIDSDVSELYFRQLEKGAEENSEESQLGFLSILNDYEAKLGWKFETVSKEPEITSVTTMVQLATN
ncbi:DUF6272 family protein [Aerosakkonema sp. BLCC-F183]|uniref:DUF6272 family protein n=1 Tax=Aerosakkonema sp. BLCC-F183 TaxID=3342834 RepID=UPI0035B6F456